MESLKMKNTTKIVYNSCYGGFGLSDKAIRRYFEIKKWNLVKKSSDLGDFYYRDNISEKNIFRPQLLSRDDATLVKVVEELKSKASASFARLDIKEINKGVRYRIDEHDGYENIVTSEETGHLSKPYVS
jgi:hypothetical protein